MKSKTEDININKEFEKIFPLTPRKSLFDDSEDYESLREYIIAQPYISPVKENLPFSEIETMHLFYIKKDGEVGRKCNAIGYFDEKTSTFVLKKGSKWVSEVTRGYLFTASELQRRIYIEKNCKVIADSIIQSRDIICKSPSAAASFVLGRMANGWKEWIDKEECCLKAVYKNSEGCDKKLVGEIVTLLQSPILNVLHILQNKGQ